MAAVAAIGAMVAAIGAAAIGPAPKYLGAYGSTGAAAAAYGIAVLHWLPSDW